MPKELKSFLIGIAVFIFFGVGFYRGCVATTNEIGYLGVDKTGRQVFIQTLNHHYQSRFNVDSDFFDYPIYQRLLQEPMRTTLRITILTDDIALYTEKSVRTSLSDSYEGLLMIYTKTISVGEDTDISVGEMRRRLNEAGARTLEDFIGGLGFKEYEVYKGGTQIVAIHLKQIRPNVKYVGAIRPLLMGRSR